MEKENNTNKIEDIIEKHELKESDELYLVKVNNGTRKYICKDCFEKGNVCSVFTNFMPGNIKDIYTDSSFYCECCDKDIRTAEPIRKV